MERWSKNKKGMVRIMTIKDIYWFVRHSCDTAIRRAGRASTDVNECLGYLIGIEVAADEMLRFIEREEDCILPFKSEEQAEKYAYDEDWVATEFDVGLNNLYKQMNLELENIEVGKTYHSHIVPYGYIQIDEEVFPVFSDDAGQCDYIRVDGENYSGGAYNFEPEREFYMYIFHHKLYQARQKVIELRNKGE